MANPGLRIQKSRSMMVSLYSLSGLAFLVALSFLGLMFYHVIVSLQVIDWQNWRQVMIHSIKVVSGALTLALPFACAFTFLTVSWATTRLAPWFKFFNRSFGQAPYLLYGLVFIAFLGLSERSLIYALSFLSVAQLSKRWIRVSEQVKIVEIECMQSLGLNVFRIIYQLYVRRFLTVYLGHLFAVYLSLFVVVTPLLCLDFYFGGNTPLVSLELFRGLLQNSSQAGVFALTLLLIHGLKVLLDSKTSFWEVEFG